jgi:uncharacterized SAM-binding protein YcdF (DUF218 family)
MSGSIVLRSLGIVAAVGFLLVSFTSLPNVLNRSAGVPAQLQPAAAIVVLGGGMQGDGVLSTSSLRRALHGIILYHRGFAPLLAFSGPASRYSPDEASVRAEMARLFGVAPAAILTETTARTTREEAIRMASLLQPLGVYQILVVTSYEHMARSRQLFENAGFTAWPAPVDERADADEPEERIQLMRRVAQEFLARAYYRLVGYL